MIRGNSKIRRLDLSFYLQEDVVNVARQLLGKVLCTRFGGELTTGIITETEAYAGITDRASHAYGGRMTERTKIMYRQGGVAYIYLCYGMHYLFNVVTNKEGIPDAVLVRGVFPLDGIVIQKQRAAIWKSEHHVGKGPGRVGKLLGFHHSQSGISLLGENIWIEDRGMEISSDCIEITPRIGVDYAGTDALLPYRFVVTCKDIPVTLCK